MIARFIEWLGRAKWLNDDISSDALRIAALEQANKALNEANASLKLRAIVWQVKAEDLQDNLDAAQPLIDYAKRQKANRAKYDAKRRGK